MEFHHALTLMPLVDSLLLDPAPFAVWIAYRTDGVKGSGTTRDPYDGSTQTRFDAVVNCFASQSNVKIHIGPSEFQTSGYADSAGNWQARPGMKMFGFFPLMQVAWIPLALCSVLLSSSSSLRAEFIGVPVLGQSGPAYAREPFALEELGVDSSRYQQVYGASQFSLLGTGGGYLNEIWFRSDNVFGRGFSANLPSIEILMGTTLRQPDELSATFADNPNGALTTAYSKGSLIFSASDHGGPARIVLQTPLFYNPAEGNLLLEIRNYQSLPPPYVNPILFPGVLDAWEVVGDPVSRVYAHDVNATTGIADTLGLTTVFVVTPVPEPSSLALAALALGMCAWWRLRKNRSPIKR